MRVVLLVIGLVIGLALAGCGAAVAPGPSPSPNPSRPPVASPDPSDGVGLRVFGILNGPPGISLPRAAVTERATVVVDQPNNVVLVLSEPSPIEIGDYLRYTLPRAGYSLVELDDAANTFVFEGHGWTVSFTGQGAGAALLLRPL